jgi:hypothetical protein
MAKPRLKRFFTEPHYLTDLYLRRYHGISIREQPT